jgi:predicted RNA-binding protein with PUA-like domain
MADKTKQALLLEQELTIPDCVALGQTMNTPGFRVLTRLYEAAVLSAHVDSVKLDPEDPHYKDKLAVRTQRERNFNELVSYVRACALVHVDRVKKQRAEDDQEAEEAVANRFGIFPATQGEDLDAVTKTFGIHAAKRKS